jgi:hypothetical protein
MFAHRGKPGTNGGTPLRWCLVQTRFLKRQLSLLVSMMSPELNCMENVWEYLRQNKLCATAWESYEAIIEACKTAWNWLIADPDRITSIGSRNWACVNV